MKWIKASERLPEYNKRVNGRLRNNDNEWLPAIVINSKMVQDFVTANGNIERVNKVEWLDESPTQSQGYEQGEEMIKFGQFIWGYIDNYKPSKETIEELLKEYKYEKGK